MSFIPDRLYGRFLHETKFHDLVMWIRKSISDDFLTLQDFKEAVSFVEAFQPPAQEANCQACASLFSEAKLATVHLTGILGGDVHLCAEHFLERFHNYRVPMAESRKDDDARG